MNSPKPVYLAIDVETTGLDPRVHNLLTGCLLSLDYDFEKISQFDFALRRDTYNVQPTALVLNGIKLSEHHEHADELVDVRHRLEPWLSAQYDAACGRLTCLGKNVHFDYGFMLENFGSAWSRYVGYSHFDISTVSMIAKRMGWLHTDNMSLVGLAEFFAIPHNAHNAESDILVTVQVLKNLLAQIYAKESTKIGINQ